MVRMKFINKVLKSLEKYLLKKNNFHLTGENYDLILFTPVDKYRADTKYSLLISAKLFNNLQQKEVIKDLLTYFKEVLESDEYSTISRLNIVNSEDPFVKNMKFTFPFRQEILEINNIYIGEANIDYAFLVKSLLLDTLIEGRAVTLEILNHGKIGIINAGILMVNSNYEIVYFTGKGLREMWKPDMTDMEKANAEKLRKMTETDLIRSEHIAKVEIDNIVRVVEKNEINVSYAMA
jgi:hypothetical protein